MIIKKINEVLIFIIYSITKYFFYIPLKNDDFYNNQSIYWSYRLQLKKFLKMSSILVI